MNIIIDIGLWSTGARMKNHHSYHRLNILLILILIYAHTDITIIIIDAQRCVWCAVCSGIAHKWDNNILYGPAFKSSENKISDPTWTTIPPPLEFTLHVSCVRVISCCCTLNAGARDRKGVVRSVRSKYAAVIVRTRVIRRLQDRIRNVLQNAIPYKKTRKPVEHAYGWSQDVMGF